MVTITFLTLISFAYFAISIFHHSIGNFLTTLDIPIVELSMFLHLPVISRVYAKTSVPARENLRQSKSAERSKLEEIITLEKIIASRMDRLNGLTIINGGRGLINELLQFVKAIRPRTTQSVVKQVASFVFLLHKLIKHSGFKGAVLYLKACQVLLQQSVGGYRVLDLADLKVRPKRTRSGLPRVIPAGVRVLITRDRHIPSIRLWMTLFGFFRIMKFAGELKLSTIIDPGVDLTSFSLKWEKFLKLVFLPQLLKRIKAPELGKPQIFQILKAGPTSRGGNVNSSIDSLTTSAMIWLRMGKLFDTLEDFASQLGAPAFRNRIELVAMAKEPILMEVFSEILDDGNFKERRSKLPHPDNPTVKVVTPESGGFNLKGTGFLGKLGLKHEPAGKIRVFAMVDAWTQWIMAPLHDYIFAILRQLKDIDGTFDQMYPMKRLQVKFQGNLAIGYTFASMDLSSATDRLPLALQRILLKILLKDIVPDSSLFAEAWGDLLVRRAYRVPRSKDEDNEKRKRSVLYSVGQPMGALSSWAMLAITHHAIVQYSAHLAGFKEWFTDYAILGDDVVIMDANVANAYRQILSNIGVGVGMAKSIVAKSKFVCEFAKKFFVDSTQADMLPIKECIATRASTSLVLEFVRKYELSLNQILAFMGYGYKTRAKAVCSNYFDLGSRLRVLLVWLSHPTSPFGTLRQTKPEIGPLPEYNLWDEFREGEFLQWSIVQGLLSFKKIWMKRNFQYENPYPYLAWLLQKSWLQPFGQVSVRTLWDIKYKLYTLLNQKFDKMEKLQYKYEQSIPDFIENIDKERPIEVSGMNLWGSTERYSSKEKLSWSNVLNPDLSGLTYVSMDVTKGSAWDLDRNDTHMRQISSDIPLPMSFYAMPGVDMTVKPLWDMNPVHKDIIIDLSFYFNKKESRYPLETDYQYQSRPLLLELEFLLELLFTQHRNESMIPDEFWSEWREDEKSFRDFLEIYTVWQDLSKPIWAEYYKLQHTLNKATEKNSILNLSFIRKAFKKSLVITNGEVKSFIELPFTIKYAIDNWIYWTIFLVFLKQEFREMGAELKHLVVAPLKWFVNMGQALLSLIIQVKNSNVYLYTGYLVDVIIVVILWWLIGTFIEDMDPESNSNGRTYLTKEDPPSKAYLPDSINWYYVAVGIGCLAIGCWLGYDLYQSYHTTLNYVDPLVRPLYLPPYAGIEEVISLGLDRPAIESLFNNLPPTTSEDLLSPASPMQMHGYWE